MEFRCIKWPLQVMCGLIALLAMTIALFLTPTIAHANSPGGALSDCKAGLAYMQAYNPAFFQGKSCSYENLTSTGRGYYIEVADDDNDPAYYDCSYANEVGDTQSLNCQITKQVNKNLGPAITCPRTGAGTNGGGGGSGSGGNAASSLIACGLVMVGDPINSSNGNHYLQDDDYLDSSGWLTFRRFYNYSPDTLYFNLCHGC